MESLSIEINVLRAAVRRLDGLQQMRERLCRCARALDRLDRALLEEQFWPDAQVDYGAFYQGSVAGFLEVAMRFQGSMRDTQHLIGNVSIEIDGDKARSECYVHAHHVIVEGAELIQLTVGGRYLDHFERRGDDWRLSFRTEVIDWGRRVPMPERWLETNDALPKGRHDRADLSYEFWKRGW